MTEQRYQAVLAVLSEGRTISEVGLQWGVDRRPVHRWLARYEAAGLEGLGDRSHRPVTCPHQTPATVEALVLELRRTHRYWGARRPVLELVRRQVEPVPSESAVYPLLPSARPRFDHFADHFWGDKHGYSAPLSGTGLYSTRGLPMPGRISTVSAGPRTVRCLPTEGFADARAVACGARDRRVGATANDGVVARSQSPLRCASTLCITSTPAADRTAHL